MSWSFTSCIRILKEFTASADTLIVCSVGGESGNSYGSSSPTRRRTRRPSGARRTRCDSGRRARKSCGAPSTSRWTSCSGVASASKRRNTSNTSWSVPCWRGNAFPFFSAIVPPANQSEAWKSSPWEGVSSFGSGFPIRSMEFSLNVAIFSFWYEFYEY